MEPPDNPGFIQIVGGHLHFHAVADRKPDPAFSHLATDRGQHEVLVVEFHPEHRTRKDGLDASLNFNMFFSHDWFILPNLKGGLGETPADRQMDAARKKKE